MLSCVLNHTIAPVPASSARFRLIKFEGVS